MILSLVFSQLVFLLVTQSSAAPHAALPLLSGELLSEGSSVGHVQISSEPTARLFKKGSSAASEENPAIRVEFRKSIIAGWTRLAAEYEISQNPIRIVIRFHLPTDGRSVEIRLEQASVGHRSFGSVHGVFLVDASQEAGPLKSIVKIPFSATPIEITKHPDWNALFSESCGDRLADKDVRPR
jgi:hypothetical protein